MNDSEKVVIITASAWERLDTILKRLEDKLDEAAKNVKPEWVTSPEAAKMLGISERTLRKRISDGYLRASRFGKATLLRRGDLNDFIERNETRRIRK